VKYTFHLYPRPNGIQPGGLSLFTITYRHNVSACEKLHFFKTGSGQSIAQMEIQNEQGNIFFSYAFQ